MSTTVTSYSVGLTLDASKYIQNSRLSRQETASLQRTINASRNPADRYTRSMELLDKALSRGTISVQTYTALQQRLNEKMQNGGKAADRQQQSLALVAARYLSLAAIVGTAKQAISLDAELQQASAQFEVFTGSVEASEQMLSDLRDLASRSPLNFRDVTEASKTMMAFNVPVRNVMGNLRMLGEITGGNSERFKSLSLAFSQSAAAGRLMGQDLLQMINAGFNPLQEISRKTGRTLIELRDDMEKGLISFKMVEDAFKSATDEGGRFNGMMDKIGETSAGAMARAQSKLEMLLSDLGMELSPLVVDIANGFEDFSPALEDATRNIGVMVDGLSSVVSLVNEVKSLGNFGDDIKAGNVAFAAPLTNLRRLSEGASTLLSGSKEEISKWAIGVREVLGRSIFPESLNEQMDNFIAKQKEALDNAKKQIDEGAVANVAVENEDGAEKQQKAITSRIASLEKELDLLQNVGEEYDRQRLIEEGATENQVFQIQQLQKQIELEKKRADEEKKRQDAAEQAAKDQARMSQDALAAARKHFDEEIKRQQKIQQDMVSQFSSVEVGSAEDIKMQAEAINRLIAPAVDTADPTEDQILAEAKKQYNALVESNTKAQKQQETMDAMLEELKNNGFKRFR